MHYILTAQEHAAAVHFVFAAWAHQLRPAAPAAAEAAVAAGPAPAPAAAAAVSAAVVLQALCNQGTPLSQLQKVLLPPRGQRDPAALLLAAVLLQGFCPSVLPTCLLGPCH